ncbi:MAG TPA: AraC family transcriptional regulator [Rhodocyclaceae bacterium]|nr:AraC family transcriptional regulator [Rhodocyclaceae bacterium]
MAGIPGDKLEAAADGARRRPPGSAVEELSSADVDETRRLVARVFCDHRLKQLGAGERLDYRQVHIAGTAVGISVIGYGARVSIDPGPLDSFYLVQIPLKGSDALRAGGSEAVSHRGCATVHSPHHHLRMCWSADCRKLVVRVDRQALERHALSLSGRPLRGALEFDLLMDTRAGPGASWARLAGGLFKELQRTPSILDSPLVAAQFEQMLMTSLLDWQPNSHLRASAERAADPCPRYVRLVEEHIDANCHLPITVDDLFAVSGVSSRSLFAAFRKHRGVSPMQHVRNVRMLRVRAELSTPSRATSVTETATRWGFLELGRFAADYRKRFGESPSDTLKRSRR